MSPSLRRLRSRPAEHGAPALQVSVRDVVELAVDAGTTGIRLLGLTPADGVGLRVLRTDPRQRSTSVPTESATSIEILLDDRRAETRWVIGLSSTNETSVEVTATEQRAACPPHVGSCPGGSVTFGGTYDDVRVDRIDCEDGWEVTEIEEDFLRGSHRRGATFRAGDATWHVAMWGFDGEDAPRADLGRRWVVSR